MASAQLGTDDEVCGWVQELENAKNAQLSKKSSSLPDPPGYAEIQGSHVSTTKRSKKDQPQQVTRKPPTSDEMDSLKLKKAWEVAIAPAKQLPMSAIGMYMTGNSLQIFSIFMVYQLFKTPFTALANLNSTFQRFETDETRQKIILAKLAYIGTNLLALAMGIWKVNKMGLLPTTRSDWLAWETAPVPLERAFRAPDI